MQIIRHFYFSADESDTDEHGRTRTNTDKQTSNNTDKHQIARTKKSETQGQKKQSPRTNPHFAYLHNRTHIPA
jgi:hypothetical protein